MGSGTSRLVYGHKRYEPGSSKPEPCFLLEYESKIVACSEDDVNILAKIVVDALETYPALGVTSMLYINTTREIVEPHWIRQEAWLLVTRSGPRACRSSGHGPMLPISDVDYIKPMLLPHGGWPMAAGPVSRLGSFEPGDKTGLRLSPHLAPSS